MKDKEWLGFFGITEENVHIKRTELFSQIHEILFHGNGGYDWETIYNMPVWLRNFTYKKIEEFYKKKNEQIDEQNNVISNTTKTDKIAKPPIQTPNQYISKTSKK